MKNIYAYLKKYKKYVFIALGILIILFFVFFRNGKNKVETYTVARSTIEQSVMLSGKIQTTDKADLGFAASGRVAKIFVKNNQSVKAGAILAQLEIGDLWADLQIKQANLHTSDVDLELVENQLEKITQQENTKVANAYRTLLSEGLVLIPDNSDLGLDIPTVSGIYDGPEGQYKINIDRKNITLPDFELRTSDLEKTQRIISETSPTPLGTKGLYLSFPVDDFAPYKDTTWYLNIPNKTSSLYLSNLNEYNEAKDARDLAIKNAEAEYEKLLGTGSDGSSIAQAEINKIQAEIRKNTIYSPFSGKVTNIEKEIGENASTGENVVTVLGENKLEVVLQVSELDVSRLTIGSPIEISLDAISKEKFYGILKTVNSKETKIDGVPVYEAFVELEFDPRIKNGMNAKGNIILAKKENVLVVPSYAIRKSGNSNFINVLENDGDIREREITLGITGTDSMVEVLYGLSEEEKVVINANAK